VTRRALLLVATLIAFGCDQPAPPTPAEIAKFCLDAQRTVRPRPAPRRAAPRSRRHARIERGTDGPLTRPHQGVCGENRADGIQGQRTRHPGGRLHAVTAWLASVWAFLCALGRQWVVLLTGSAWAAADVVAQRVVHWQPPAWLPPWFVWALMGLGGLVACYRAWLEERRARTELEAAWSAGPVIAKALAPLIADGNALQASLDHSPETQDELIERRARQGAALTAWVNRAEAQLKRHCPEHAPGFARQTDGDVADQLDVYLDRLVDIQRTLASTR
jgi:hypothetical protein